MVKKYDNQEITAVFEIGLQTVRRIVKDHLAPDPGAPKQGGRRRTYCVNDVFTIYLANYFVANMDYPIEESKTILKILKPWMLKEGLFPEKTNEYSPKFKDARSFDIMIHRAINGGGLLIKCRALFRDAMPRYGSHEHIEFKDEYITTPMVGQTIKSLTTDYRVMNISVVLNLFKHKLGMLSET